MNLLFPYPNWRPASLLSGLVLLTTHYSQQTCKQRYKYGVLALYTGTVAYDLSKDINNASVAACDSTGGALQPT